MPFILGGSPGPRQGEAVSSPPSARHQGAEHLHHVADDRADRLEGAENAVQGARNVRASIHVPIPGAAPREVVEMLCDGLARGGLVPVVTAFRGLPRPSEGTVRAAENTKPAPVPSRMKRTKETSWLIVPVRTSEGVEDPEKEHSPDCLIIRLTCALRPDTLGHAVSWMGAFGYMIGQGYGTPQ